MDLVAQGEPVAQVAKKLGISEWCLRRWKSQTEVDAGRAEGLSGAEKKELVELRRKNRVLELEVEILKGASANFCAAERTPKIGFRLVCELAVDGVPVAVSCRVLKVSRAGYYKWRGRHASAREVADDQRVDTITQVHHDSRGTYGSPRVHAELRLRLGLVCGRKRVARLMRTAGFRGICHQPEHRHWKPDPATHDDLVKRQFTAGAPDRVWFTDITQHRAAHGWVYCSAVVDAFSDASSGGRS